MHLTQLQAVAVLWVVRMRCWSGGGVSAAGPGVGVGMVLVLWWWQWCGGGNRESVGACGAWVQRGSSSLISGPSWQVSAVSEGAAADAVDA